MVSKRELGGAVVERKRCGGGARRKAEGEGPRKTGARGRKNLATYYPREKGPGVVRKEELVGLQSKQIEMQAPSYLSL